MYHALLESASFYLGYTTKGVSREIVIKELERMPKEKILKVVLRLSLDLSDKCFSDYEKSTSGDRPTKVPTYYKANHPDCERSERIMREIFIMLDEARYNIRVLFPHGPEKEVPYRSHQKLWVKKIRDSVLQDIYKGRIETSFALQGRPGFNHQRLPPELTEHISTFNFGKKKRRRKSKSRKRKSVKKSRKRRRKSKSRKRKSVKKSRKRRRKSKSRKRRRKSKSRKRRRKSVKKSRKRRRKSKSRKRRRKSVKKSRKRRRKSVKKSRKRRRKSVKKSRKRR
jgi:hypothetical protein